MTPCVIEAWRPVLIEIVAALEAGERQASTGRGADTLGAGCERRDGTPLRAVFRQHFFFALDFCFAELPFHSTCPSTFQPTRCGTRVDVAEHLEDGFSRSIDPVEREFKTPQ